MRPCTRLTALPFAALAAFSMGCVSGQGKSKPSTGATVTSQDLDNPNEPIEWVLQRKVPGLEVRRTTDGSIALQIRGTTSYSGDPTPPLFILNGLPYQAGPGGTLTGIDPHDIETIKVLKGAEAGIYGVEGANGVIVITTKKGGNSRR